ncbi:MAG: tRNA (guanosine(37)-N1)-methyltransferase TrmD [Alphaproteobacteria bacterium]
METDRRFHSVVLTLFPELFPGPLGASIIGEALEKGLWGLDVLNIRDFALDKHQTVDEPAFGGGPGMVMRPDVLDLAIEAGLRCLPETKPAKTPAMIYLSPRGQTLSQKSVTEWVESDMPLVLLCGRYEGVDQRILDARGFQEVSLGDFVLAGGELAAMALLEACVRLIPGVLGTGASLEEESFSQGLLEYPHYTRPRTWEGMEVPEVLLSGHHGKIKAWRQAQAEKLTQTRRPDLWTRYQQRGMNEKSED